MCVETLNGAHPAFVVAAEAAAAWHIAEHPSQRIDEPCPVRQCAST